MTRKQTSTSIDWSGSRILRDTVIPSKRVVIGNPAVPIPTDLREWVTPPDSQEMRAALDEMKLPRDKQLDSFDQRARRVWRFVAEHIVYDDDLNSTLRTDFWQFPAETLALGRGDCEDCSFLLASLLLASGISPFCVRIVFGQVHQSSTGACGHSWPIYKDEEGQWRLLESTLDALSLPEEWPLADDLARPGSDPRYFPDICANQHHVWTIGKRRIRNVAGHLDRIMRKHRPES